MVQPKSVKQSVQARLTDTAKLGRAEMAELERIRALTPPRKPGATYPAAEQLIREDRDTQ